MEKSATKMLTEGKTKDNVRSSGMMVNAKLLCAIVVSSWTLSHAWTVLRIRLSGRTRKGAMAQLAKVKLDRTDDLQNYSHLKNSIERLI